MRAPVAFRAKRFGVRGVPAALSSSPRPLSNDPILPGSSKSPGRPSAALPAQCEKSHTPRASRAPRKRREDPPHSKAAPSAAKAIARATP